LLWWTKAQESGNLDRILETLKDPLTKQETYTRIRRDMETYLNLNLSLTGEDSKEVHHKCSLFTQNLIDRLQMNIRTEQQLRAHSNPNPTKTQNTRQPPKKRSAKETGKEKGNKKVKLDTPPPIYFKGERHPLSNLYPTPLRAEGILFNSSENLYQWRKACMIADDQERYRDQKKHDILAATPRQAMKIGQTFLVPLWEEVRLSIMMYALRFKKQQCPAYCTTLIQSGDRPLMEDTKHPFWANGPDGQGHQRLGYLHQKIRDSLFAEKRGGKDPIPHSRVATHRTNHDIVLTIGDSMVGRYSIQEGMQVYLEETHIRKSFRGYRTSQFHVGQIVDTVKEQGRLIEDLKTVIVHAGVNDIPEMIPSEEFKSNLVTSITNNLRNLGTRVQEVIGSVHMVWSSILPRPRSSQEVNYTINQINYHVAQALTKFGWTSIEHENFRHRHGGIRQTFFNQRDKLHLTETGVTQWVWNTVNNLHDSGLVKPFAIRGGGQRPATPRQGNWQGGLQ
jgi:predicted NAD-dependent protein-ADP-ribosyltransferase YbiA (DUF1768 family)